MRCVSAGPWKRIWLRPEENLPRRAAWQSQNGSWRPWRLQPLEWGSTPSETPSLPAASTLGCSGCMLWCARWDTPCITLHAESACKLLLVRTG